MSNELNFLETLTLSELKQRQAASINVFTKSSGGYYFRCGSLTGHISQTVQDFTKPDELLVSLVETNDGQFWMMHLAGGQTPVATL